MERRNFELCKVNHHRVLISLEEKTPEQLRSSGVLGRSALYIRPEVEYCSLFNFSVVQNINVLFFFFSIFHSDIENEEEKDLVSSMRK